MSERELAARQVARARALDALDGLSVGDAFGEQFFVEEADRVVQYRTPPDPPWLWTDDTAMAISLLPIVGRHGAVDKSFSRAAVVAP